MKGTRRHRYIFFKVTYDQAHAFASQKELLQALRQNTYERFLKNTKDLGLWIVRFDGTTGIIKCHYRETENVKQLLLAMKSIGTKPVSITTHATSGTIHGLTDKKPSTPNSWKPLQ